MKGDTKEWICLASLRLCGKSFYVPALQITKLPDDGIEPIVTRHFSGFPLILADVQQNREVH